MTHFVMFHPAIVLIIAIYAIQKLDSAFVRLVVAILTLVYLYSPDTRGADILRHDFSVVVQGIFDYFRNER